MDGYNVTELDPQVLAHNLVNADLGLLTGVICQDDANSVLPLLALMPKPLNQEMRKTNAWKISTGSMKPEAPMAMEQREYNQPRDLGRTWLASSLPYLQQDGISAE